MVYRGVKQRTELSAYISYRHRTGTGNVRRIQLHQHLFREIMTVKIILISGNQLAITSHGPGSPAVNGANVDNPLYPHRWYSRADERLFFTPTSQYRIVE